MGFDLSQHEVVITLTASQGGKEHKLEHIFREPKATDWKEFGRKASGLVAKGRKVEFRDDTHGAREWLWNQCIIRVNGYDFEPGKPLTPETPNWKELVPFQHKSLAVAELGGVSVELGEETEDFLGKSSGN